MGQPSAGISVSPGVSLSVLALLRHFFLRGTFVFLRGCELTNMSTLRKRGGVLPNAVEPTIAYKSVNSRNLKDMMLFL